MFLDGVFWFPNGVFWFLDGVFWFLDGVFWFLDGVSCSSMGSLDGIGLLLDGVSSNEVFFLFNGVYRNDEAPIEACRVARAAAFVIVEAGQGAVEVVEGEQLAVDGAVVVGLEEGGVAFRQVEHVVAPEDGRSGADEAEGQRPVWGEAAAEGAVDEDACGIEGCCLPVRHKIAKFAGSVGYGAAGAQIAVKRSAVGRFTVKRMLAIGGVVMALSSCGGEPEELPQVGCRLNSDCAVGQVCNDAGQCEADEGGCQGPQCPCTLDADCPTGQACDVDSGACFALECLKTGDCDLGQICQGGRCLTDLEADRDRDGVPDAEDRCPEIEDVDQADNDGDGDGDACDGDDDNDAMPDALDNCPLIANAAQGDANVDGLGNACDPEVSGTTVIGRVDFSAAGDPDTGQARVFITGRQEPVSIDEQGGFVFDSALAEGGRFTLQVLWPGFKPFTGTFEAPVNVEVFEVEVVALELAPATMVGSARLQGQGDHGDIIVQAFIGDALVAESRTDEGGAWALVAVETDIRLRFSRRAYLPETLAASWDADEARFEVDGEPLSAFDGIELRPNLNAALTGQLSSPVADLSWVGAVRLSGVSGVVTASIDSQGGFRFDALQPGAWQMEIAAAGHAPYSAALSLNVGENTLAEIALALDRSRILRGVARLEGRADHGGVVVQASVDGTPVGSALTGADGSFALTTAALDHDLSFSKEAFEAAAVRATWDGAEGRFEIGAAPAEQTPTLLEADRSASLQGLVRTPTGLPGIAVARLVGQHEVLLALVRQDGGFIFDAVQPGLYLLEVSAQGHITVTTPVALASGEAAELEGPVELRLENGQEEPQGVPLSGGARLAGRGRHGGIVVEARVGGALVGSAITNDEGGFGFLAARLSYTLRFSAEHFVSPPPVEVLWDEEEERFEVQGAPVDPLAPLATLQPDTSATLSGSVTSSIEGLDFSAIATIRLISDGGQRQIGAQARGGFQFVLVQPGLHILEIEVDGHLPVSRAIVLESGDNALAPIALVPEFEAPEQAAVMRGQAQLQGRSSHAGIVVQAFVGQSLVGASVTDQSGDFVLSAARLDHTLRFVREDYGVESLDVVWSEARERFEAAGRALEGFGPVALRPLLNAGLRGRLTSSVENLDFAQVGVRIELVGEQGPAPPPTRNVDAFAFAQLQPGLYGIQIAVDGHVPHAAVVRLDANETLDMGDIALSEQSERPETAVVLVGRARLDDGAEPSGILVRLLQNGVPVATGLTDAQGGFGFLASRVNYRLEMTREGYGPQPVTVDVIWNRNRERFEVGGQPLEDFDGAVLARITGQLTITVSISPDWIPQAQRTARVRVVGQGREVSDEGVGHDAPVAFQDLPSGSYVVFVERQGFSSAQAVVALNADEDNPSVALQINLVELSAAGLDLRGVALSAQDLSGISLIGANFSGVDLSGQDLRGLDLSGTNLTNADLTAANLTCARMDGANLFGASLASASLLDTSLRFATLASANLTQARFSDADGPVVCQGPGAPNPQIQPLFTGAILTQAILTGADLRGADLRGADLNYTSLGGADLSGANLSGVTMILANLSAASLRDATLDGAVLLNAIMLSTDATRASMRRALLNSAIIEQANFRDAVLIEANFNGTTIVRTQMLGADATGARFVGVAFSGQRDIDGELRGVIFDGAELVGALFNNTDMTAASFIGADLRSATFVSADFGDPNNGFADFQGADLTTASLVGADLRGVNFSDADLSFANLSRSKTAGSTLDRARWDGTTCPDRSNSDESGNTCLGHLYSGAACQIRPGVQCADANLENADLRMANLQGADLSNSSFFGADVRGANFAGATLGGVLGSNFSGALIDSANFANASMIRVSFSNLDARDVNFMDTQWGGNGVFNATCDRCNLAGAQLPFMDTDEFEAFFVEPLYDSQSALPEVNLEGLGAILIPDGLTAVLPGVFIMGSPGSELGRRDTENPQHTVVISRAFLMGRREVTQRQWLDALGVNPSEGVGDNRPVESVSFPMALAFCNAQSVADGLTPCYDLSQCTGAPSQTTFNCPDEVAVDLDCQGWRLPTEAEWEFAYRAGSRLAFHNGDLTVPLGDDPNLNLIGWYNENAQDTQNVGLLLPNAWGLFDMSGNVFEWVFDWENFDYFNRQFVVDPLIQDKPSPFTTNRIVRGGSFLSLAQNSRAAFRDDLLTTFRSSDTGLRIVRTLP